MNWTNILYWSIGGTFFLRLWEASRMNILVNEARAYKEQVKKPILLISSLPRPNFDVTLNVHQEVWTLPFPDKHFAAVVSDALEHIPYPKEAITEWQRVADRVLITTHVFFSPEAWLDLRHYNVFFGDAIVPVHPPMNWALVGGTGYFLYAKRRKKPKRLTQALPAPTAPPEVAEDEEIEDEIESEPEEEKEEEIIESEPEPEEEEEEVAGVKDTPKTRQPKIEPAPIFVPPQLPPPKESIGGLGERGKGGQRNTQYAQDVPKVYNLLPSPQIGKKINLTLSSGLESGNLKAIDEFTKKRKIDNLTIDPVRLSEAENQKAVNRLRIQPADTATLVNVFSAQPKEERLGALQVASESLRRGGKVYIAENGGAKKYITEILSLFPDAHQEGDYIVAQRR